MSKGFFWDETLTFFLKTISFVLDFPAFKIGLFQKWIFQKNEAMIKGYFLDQAVTNLFLKTFFLLHWLFLYSKLDCFKMDFPKKNEAMSKGYVLDQALTIFFKAFFLNWIFIFFKIGFKKIKKCILKFVFSKCEV